MKLFGEFLFTFWFGELAGKGRGRKRKGSGSEDEYSPMKKVAKPVGRVSPSLFIKCSCWF